VFRLVDAAFAQRRKTLRQALAGVAGGTDAAAALLTAAGVDPGERGERLGIDAFVALAERLPG
jgi:16S rRNA (adenine1518-N6/adenine1519-N6)-dimethyltransferase